jgi:hypothetical protein
MKWVIVFVAACGAHAATPKPIACDGDVVIVSVDQLAGVAACGKIAGNLTIRGASHLDLDALAPLTEVGGDLVVGPTFAMDVVSLPGLRRVGGAVHIISNGAATDGSFPALEHAGSLEVAANVAMAGFTAPVLRDLDHDLAITGNPALENLDLSALATIGGATTMTDNPQLSIIEIPEK